MKSGTGWCNHEIGARDYRRALARRARARITTNFNPALKLGARLGLRDPRILKLRAYAPKTGLPDPDPVIDYDGPAAGAYQMWANDQAGDCVFAAYYNLLAGAAKQTGDSFSATDAQVLADYAAVTGYDPATGDNDNGTNPEDALKFYSKLPDDDPRKIIAYGEVDRHDLVQVRQAMEIFGGVYTALALPYTAKHQVGNVWDVAPFYMLGRTPGSWGGHMTMTRRCDATGSEAALWTVTWGTTQQMTEDFWMKYCSAAYFFINHAWIADVTSLTPGGLNLERLLADVQELKAA